MAPTILDGTPVNPDDYPASFYAKLKDGYCSSTLVAPRVALTAAHCAVNGGTITLTVAGKAVVGHCDRAAPVNAANSGLDWTLCLLEQAIPNVPYENINANAALPKPGDTIKLTGFGCIHSDGTGGNDGTFREGPVTVTKLSSTNGTVFQTSGKVALCSGDSGGSAFFGFDAGYTRRVVIAVNSMATRDPVQGTFLYTSYITSVADPAAQAYFNDWIHRNGIPLCGMSPAPDGCRSQ